MWWILIPIAVLGFLFWCCLAMAQEVDDKDSRIQELLGPEKQED